MKDLSKNIEKIIKEREKKTRCKNCENIFERYKNGTKSYYCLKKTIEKKKYHIIEEPSQSICKDYYEEIVKYVIKRARS